MLLTGAALGEQRRMIFENVANGVPVPDIMATFFLSQLEVDQTVAFVAKKIKEYRFRRHMPPLECDSFTDIRWNRLALLETLRKLGPVYLSSSLLLPKVSISKISDGNMLKEAAQKVQVYSE